ncbi:type II toxin-antitoxin system RelE/ParE family toxin [Elusimicrobiota bacterium]
MHKIELSRIAEKTYRWLYRRDRKLFDRIDAALAALAEDPTLGKPLKGTLQGDRSHRVGSYRIIYTVAERKLIVYVLDIGHRQDIYK